MNVKYTINCTCKHRRTYEAQTLGDCMKLAEADGWVSTGEGTKKVCKECQP
jgi:hypothetical protein